MKPIQINLNISPLLVVRMCEALEGIDSSLKELLPLPDSEISLLPIKYKKVSEEEGEVRVYNEREAFEEEFERDTKEMSGAQSATAIMDFNEFSTEGDSLQE